MSTETRQRAMGADERAHLQQLLAMTPSRLRSAMTRAAAAWAAAMICLLILWGTVAWPGRALLGMDFGWNSPWAPWLLAAGGVIATALAGHSTARWLATHADYRRLLLTDLAGGRVNEERLRFTAAKRLQEPEHGGLVYFLLTPEQRVFVLYDHESQDLGARGEDPLSSDFRPRSEYLIVRGPATGFVIGQAFAGTALELPPPLALGVPPGQWPQAEEFCEVPWEELERRFGAEPG